MVLIGHAFHPNDVDAAVTPEAAAAERTTLLPSTEGAAVALYVIASEPTIVKLAQVLARTLNSVWQWSSAATSPDGTFVKLTVADMAEPEPEADADAYVGGRYGVGMPYCSDSAAAARRLPTSFLFLGCTDL